MSHVTRRRKGFCISNSAKASTWVAALIQSLRQRCRDDIDDAVNLRDRIPSFGQRLPLVIDGE